MEHLFKLLNEEEKRKQQTKEVALFNTPKPTTTTSKPVAVTTPTKDILPSEAALAVKPVEKSGFFERINWKQVAIWGTIVAAVVTIIAVPCALLIGGDGGVKKITSNDFWNNVVTPVPQTDDTQPPRKVAFSSTEDKDYIKNNLTENILYFGFYGKPNDGERRAWYEYLVKIETHLKLFDETWDKAGNLTWWTSRPQKDDAIVPPMPVNCGVTKAFWSSTTKSGEKTFALAKGNVPIDLDDISGDLIVKPIADSTIDIVNNIVDSYSYVFLNHYDDTVASDGVGNEKVLNLGTTLSSVDAASIVE